MPVYVHLSVNDNAHIDLLTKVTLPMQWQSSSATMAVETQL